MDRVSFPPIDIGVWQRQVLDELKGRPLEKLNRTLPGGLAVRPLYTERPDVDLPVGAAGWERCQRHHGAHPDVAAHIAADVAGGVEAIWLESGAALSTAADLQAALSNVRRIRLDAGGDALAMAAVLLGSGLDLEADGIRLGMDPTGTLATGGPSTSLEAMWSQAAALVRGLHRHLPGARALTLSTAPYHLAGASAAQELGIAAASLVAALRALESEGLSPERVAGSLEWSMPMGRDVFLNVARLRALRTLHAAVLSQCGVADCDAQIHAFSSPTTLTDRDPWVNLLRVTTHGYAAVLGGADSITTAPFDTAGGSPGSLGRRIARNTQIILDEECHLGQIVDPTRGSYYVESLTDALLNGAWAQLQSIEAAGGLAAVLLDGSLAGELAASRQQIQDAVHRRKQPITGVSEFPILSQPPLPREPSDAPAVSAAAPYTGPTDLDALIQAAREGVSLPAIAAALRGTPPDIEPLPVFREAADFEALRDRVDAWTAAGNDRPAVYLANLGHPVAWTARATFATNLLAAGGIGVIADVGTGDAAPQQAAEGLAERSRGAAGVVLCGTDAAYESHGPAVLEKLSGWTLLAGRVALIGVDQHIHLGCDAHAILTELLDVLGVSR